jgi:hypothetical protein
MPATVQAMLKTSRPILRKATISDGGGGRGKARGIRNVGARRGDDPPFPVTCVGYRRASGSTLLYVGGLAPDRGSGDVGDLAVCEVPRNLHPSLSRPQGVGRFFFGVRTGGPGLVADLRVGSLWQGLRRPARRAEFIQPGVSTPGTGHPSPL